jgi:uncharacterized RDD family membrane protein YckC
MKCPKCSYIGFEPADRCRNCGFDFSLAPIEDPAVDLPIRQAEPMGPLADFDLGEAGRPPRLTPTSRADVRREDPSLDPGVPPAPPPGTGVGDLPLFGNGFPDDPLLVRPAAASAPLAVRRSTPTRPRPAPASRVPDRQPDLILPLGSAMPLSATEWSAPSRRAADGEVARIGPRIAAAVLDGLLLAALDAAVVYFTLRVSRLDTSGLALLPPAPLAAFLLLLNGGYLTVFTAATGQTIGKMALHLRVISAADEPLTIGGALLRAAALLVCALPAGLGLMPAAFDRAGRGLHDRLAATRVISTASP